MRGPLIITGDFNIHVDIPSDSIQFSELLRSLSLIKHVNQPTHEKAHTLDLKYPVLLTASSPLIQPQAIYSATISPSLIVSRFPKLLLPHRRLLPIDPISSTQSLCAKPPEHLEELIASYNSTLSSIYDQHALSRNKTIVTRPRVSQDSEKEG